MSVAQQKIEKSETISKILVAEDSKAEQVQLRRLLEASGYEVAIVNSGNEVLETIESIQPDLILMDIIMDEGDGYQTCRKLKRNDATKHIPVIMVSSKNNEVDKKWAIKLGALDYIVKPYEETQLLQRLSDI